METGEDLELGVLARLVVAMEPRHVPDVATVQPPVTGDDIAPGSPQKEGNAEGGQVCARFLPVHSVKMCQG